MGWQWVATRAKTGEVLNDLPDLADQQGNGAITVAQTIGRYESTVCGLPLPTAPPEWVRSTKPLATNIILLQDNPLDPSHGIPVWGGQVTSRTPDETDILQLTLATVDSYFDRRYTGAQTFTNVGQNDIINSLMSGVIQTGTPNGGIPIRVQYVTAGSGTLRTRTYLDQDDKTVYSALTDLMGVQGGPEWTVGWEWQTNPERITPVLYVGDRIGSAVAPGMQPNVTFELPGPVMRVMYTEDYSNGKGANSVIATSSGQGTLRPQSSPQTFTDVDRPTVEYRYTPSTSITDVPTLTTWAQSALAQMQYGTGALAVTMVSSAEGCPQLGTDWFLGDTVGFKIGGVDPVTGREMAPGFPGGWSSNDRVIGYQLQVEESPLLTPIIYGPNVQNGPYQ